VSKKRTQLKPVGKRKKQEKVDTQAPRAAYLKSHPLCEIVGPDCTNQALAIHERKKRSQGGSLVDPANLMACCFYCNGHVEDNPALYKSLGIVVSSWQLPEEVPVYRREQP
jgi:5-methylcytosine-specific restriction endonuclease McrA